MTGKEEDLLKIALLHGWSLGEFALAVWRYNGLDRKPETYAEMLTLYRPVTSANVAASVK